MTGNIYNIDSHIIVLYDPEEESFFYYGTRQRHVGDKYVTYSGAYHYTRGNALVNFLKQILNGFQEVITYEFHDVYIQQSEYRTLDFFKLREKISKQTEIAAYDKFKINSKNITEWLDLLLTHQI
jgi:hypothetical protein